MRKLKKVAERHFFDTLRTAEPSFFVCGDLQQLLCLLIHVAGAEGDHNVA